MTIAIIDQYPIVRKGLMLFLTNEYKQCILLESESVADFKNKYQDESPDVIIIALSQDFSVSNLETISLIKQWYDLKTVIVYDDDSDLAMIRSHFRLGIYNYLSKQSGLTELSNCIAKVLNGETYVDQEVIIKYWTNLQEKTLCVGDRHLSNREYEIAVYLSEGRKTSWIANKLARKASTISTTKATIFKKLSVDNVIHLKERIDASLGAEILKLQR